MDVTTKIADFIVDFRYEDLPAVARETARTAVLDCLGVTVAGGREESSQICARLAQAEGSRQETTVIGHGFRASVLQAAFVNGTSAHAADFDHSFVVGGQPTAPVLPAAFTLAESLGASGRQLLEAYAAGFEVTAKLAFAVREAGGGWHPNSVHGAFGATAAASKLLRLDHEQVVMALAITASMASGLTANFGTMTKPLHVGLAARNGVQAAQLAAAGFTANPATLETRNGFFDSFYRGQKIDEAPLIALGRSFALEENGIRLKPYPCGGLTHTAIYSAIELRDRHGIKAEMVDHVLVNVPQGTYQTIAFRVPQTALEGKFSMGYLIARALIDGKVTLETFTEEAVRDPAVLALLEKVEMRADPDLSASSDGARPAAVAIRLKDGHRYAMDARFPKGGPQLPMTPAEIEAKFRDCLKGVISDENCERALRQLADLDAIDDIRPIAALLAGPTAASIRTNAPGP